MLKTRTKEKQSDHDKCVKNLATEWVKEEWLVKADLENWYEKPSKIEKYVPDIEAKMGSLTIICEIETEDTFEAHREQWETFKKYCEKTKNYHFVGPIEAEKCKVFKLSNFLKILEPKQGEENE